MRVYLITHSHTEQIPGEAIDAWRLSARGVDQSVKLATNPFWDEIERVVVSSEPKTWLTVEQVAIARQLPVWIDCRFDELRRSGWTENYGARVAAAFTDPQSASIGWEALATLRNRVVSGFEALQQQFPGETLAVVGHGICLSTLRAELLGDERVNFDAWQRLQFGSYACVEAGRRGTQIVSDFALSQNSER